MKALYTLALSVALISLMPSHAVRAQDVKKLDLDKAKGALEKLAGEAKKALGRAADEKSGALWSHSKDMLAQPKEEYMKRVESAQKTMDAEIKALAEAESAVNSRDYFKSHLESLKQHLAYCKLDAEKLGAADSEESFRVKQKKFDRTMGFLAEGIQLAKDEAGL